MGNKVKIGNKEYRIEDEQQLEAEVDWCFPSEDTAIAEAGRAIDHIHAAICLLEKADFESNGIISPGITNSIASLKKEVSFLNELIKIVKS